MTEKRYLVWKRGKSLMACLETESLIALIIKAKDALKNQLQGRSSIITE